MNRFLALSVVTVMVGLLLSGLVLAQGWENIRINDDQTQELQNEQQVVVNPTNPLNLVAVWRDFRLGYRQVGYGFTNDGGFTWTNPGLFVDPHYQRDSDPALTVNAEGDFFAMLLAYTGDTGLPNGMLMYRSTDGGQTWEDRGFAIDGVPGVFEDKEFIACDRTGSPFHGRIYMAWTRFYTTDILCVSSGDEGDTWTSERLVSDNSGTQFPTPAVGPDGTLYVAWTDFNDDALKIDRSFDGGLTFGNDIMVNFVANPSAYLNGDISSPAHPAMDIDISGSNYNGRIYIAYLSIANGSSDYDIFIQSSDFQGVIWSAPIRVNDDDFNNGRDQFHPWLTVDNNGAITVIWLDRRHDPSNLRWHCYLSQSFDGGLTWSANQQVSTVESDPNDAKKQAPDPGKGITSVPVMDEADTRAGLIGEYIGIACWDGHATPVWTDTRNGHQDTYGGWMGATAVEDDEPLATTMLRIFPNPALGPTTLHFAVPVDGWVSLKLFDVAGRLVRTLVDRKLRRGSHQFVWNGTDQTGGRVASGAYLVRFEASGAQETRTIILRR